MSGDRLLYIYAIVDEVPADLGLGLGGAPLCGIAPDQAAAIVSEHYGIPEGDEDGFWRHEAVVERLMEEVVVLPFRFGATVTDEGAVEALLEERGDEFVRRFDDVRGAVELSVRAELREDEPSAVSGVAEEALAGAGASASTPSTGTEYMRTRSRRLEEHDHVREALHAPLASMSRRSLLLTASGEADFKGAYLVETGLVDAFAEQVRALARDLQIEVSCTGPWPPYSFVAEDER